MVEAIPSNYSRICPYLTVVGGEQAIQFYTAVFGGVERMRLPMPDGKIGHAEIAFGDSVIMIADQHPMMGNKAPADFGGSPVTLMLYVDDVDATVALAKKNGAKITSPPEDQFYGDRTAMVEDPFGHIWSLMTHVKDVSPEEMATAMAQMGQA